MRFERLKNGPCGDLLGLPGVDPLLVWADASGFRDFLRPPAALPAWLPVLCQMAEGRSLREFADELLRRGDGEIPPIYQQPAGLRHCTAWLAPSYLRDHAAGQAGRMLSALQLQMPVIPQRAIDLPAPPSPWPAATRPQSEGPCLIGVIDDGCPFAHPSLRALRAGRAATRVLALWQQDSRQPGRPLPDFCYGRELLRDDLDALMRDCSHGAHVDEAACYSALGWSRLAARFSHGAAVLDLLAGPRALRARMFDADDRPPAAAIPDAASQADIVFVGLPADAVQDSSSASLDRYVLDGLRYIISCAKPGVDIVVNISNGSSRCSHDGTSALELAMQELVAWEASQGRRLQIVIAAGNARDEELHAEAEALPVRFDLRVPPASESPSWVYLRIPTGWRGRRIGLRMPDGRLGWCKRGEARAWVEGKDGQALAALVWPRPARGKAGLAMVVLAPSLAQFPAAQAPHGDWQILFSGKDGKCGALHAFVCRNQRNAGALPRSLQARFVSDYEAYDPDRWRRSRHEDPAPACSPIRRAGTLNGFATSGPGAGLWVVGGRWLKPDRDSAYSSMGPAAGPDGAPSRLDVDAREVTDLHANLLGVVCAGSLGGQWLRARGTSFAAPQTARRLVNGEALAETELP